MTLLSLWLFVFFMSVLKKLCLFKEPLDRVSYG